MKNITKLVLLTLTLSLLLAGCNLIANQTQTSDEFIQTIADYAVKLTVQASEIDLLKQALTESPDACPTCVVCPTTTPCPVNTPCPVCPTVAPEPTPTATKGIPVGTASISGKLIYPSDHIPPQRVIAFEVKTGYYYWVRTATGNASYTISNLPAGTYRVVSYKISESPTGLKAGYTPFAACNFTCAEDHSLIEFELKEGEHKTGIDPIDWYAPEDVDWPDEP